MKTQRRFKFADSAPLEIHFERKLAGGWHLALETSDKVVFCTYTLLHQSYLLSQISPEDVRFWDKDPQDLEMMEEDGIYPPRFEIEVCGSHAKEPINAAVIFRGMAGKGSNMTELLLEPSEAEGVFKSMPSLCSCSIIFCSLNAAAAGGATSTRRCPLLSTHSQSEPVLGPGVYVPVKVERTCKNGDSVVISYNYFF